MSLFDNEKVTAVLVYQANGKTMRNVCKYWPNYGHVCPGCITTNGSLRMLRDYIAGQIEPSYVSATRRDVPDFDCRLETADGAAMTLDEFDAITAAP